MGTRQSDSRRKVLLRWKRFIAEERELLLRIGMPDLWTESLEKFQDFLMHGYLDHHSDNSQMTVDDLNEAQYQCLCRFVSHYFSAGFDDPGLTALRLDDQERLRREFPARFSER